MAYQNITASLSPDIQEIKAAFATTEAKLPFLVIYDGHEQVNGLNEVTAMIK